MAEIKGKRGYTYKDMAVYVLGLGSLGFIKDPVLSDYKKRGCYLEDEIPCSMSVDGLRTSLHQLAGLIDEDAILESGVPPQGRVCYVAMYTLTAKGMEGFLNQVFRMVEDGIINPEFGKTIEQAYAIDYGTWPSSKGYLKSPVRPIEVYLLESIPPIAC
jgi:hypothetical protein